MIATADYTSAAYDTLPLFDEAQRTLAYHKSDLAQLGELIVKHNLEDHIGVSLLHRHFNLHNNEKMVRRFGENIAFTSAEKIDQGIAPVQWRVFKISGIILFSPTEFIHTGSFSSRALDQTNLLRNSFDFLEEFAEALCSRSVQGIFGLSTKNILTDMISDPADQIIAEIDTAGVVKKSHFEVVQRPKNQEPADPALWTFSKSIKGGVELRADYTCSQCRQ